jgi:hypothetical protein
MSAFTENDYKTPPNSPRPAPVCPGAPKIGPIDELKYRISKASKATDYTIDEDAILEYLRNGYNLKGIANTYPIISASVIERLVSYSRYQIKSTHRCANDRCRHDMGLEYQNRQYCSKVCQYGGTWV